ncbi:hypothetical protein PQQ78_42315, partial [Paraburkholderia sediminicola]
PLSPLSNYLSLLFIVFMMVTMYLTASIKTSVFAIPIWIVAVHAAFSRVRQSDRAGHRSRSVNQVLEAEVNSGALVD